MNQNFAQKVSQIYSYWFYASPIVMPILWVGLAIYVLTFKKEERRPAVVAVQEHGQVISLACDKQDKAHQKIIVDLAKRLTQVLFAYEKESKKPYAQKYVEFKRYVDPYGPAAKKIHRAVVENLGQGEKQGRLRHETSAFQLDMDSVKMISKGDKYYMTADGVRKVQGDSGQDTQNIQLNITLVDGGSDEVFRIFDTSIAKL